jgi:xanthine phosphoribosyltransferase
MESQMRLLEERIKEDGQVRPGNILKVDSFLNHQLDVSLLEQLGKEFFERFKDKGITRILTIEASGIALACLAAQYFKVPVVFAKKAKSKNLDGELYTSTVHSFTYGKDFTVTLSKKFLTKDDTVLLIDDFLAVGKAMRGLIDICGQAEANIAGIGIAIEKGFQSGGKELREMGFDVYSLAIIDEMDDEGNISFKEQ